MIPGLLLLAIAAVYARGVHAAWKRCGVGRGITRGQAWAFGAGLIILAVAFSPALDDLADTLFAAHMTEHMLLATVAPPFLVLGAPQRALAWVARDLKAGMPGLARRIYRVLRLFRPTRYALLPALVVIHALAFWIWHIPPLFVAALQHPALHALEHECFLISAMAIWWVILTPARGMRRRTYGAGVVALFATMMQTGALGALLTLSRHPWYVAAGSDLRLAVAPLGLVVNPLEDQQLGGLIMWVVGGLLYVIAMSVLFIAWMERPLWTAATGRGREAEAARQGTGRGASPARAAGVIGAALLVSVSVSGCQRSDQNVVIPQASIDRGRTALHDAGCGACHMIAGVEAASGLVGPPLTGVASRSMLAGMLPNTPENMIHWIRDPQSVAPGTAMPNLQVSEQMARDMAAYLYTLR